METIKKIFSHIKKNRKKSLIIATAFLCFILFLFFLKSKAPTDTDTTPENNTFSLEEDTSGKQSKTKKDTENPKEIAKETLSGQAFYNAARNYQFSIPSNFTIYESQDIIYVRNLETKTQIAVIYIPGTFADGIGVWEQSTEYIYKIKALLTDEEGNTEEKRVANYGTSTKTDTTIGEYPIKQEVGEMWFRNVGEGKNIKLAECGYFTTFKGNGIIFIGNSQTEDTTQVFTYMKELVSSLKEYTPPEEPLEYETFVSGENDGISFAYPKGWTITRNKDGMVSIKAPETQSCAYAGCTIQFMADYEKTIVEDFAQYSAAYETQILKDTFLEEVSDTDFTYTSVVTLMDMEKKLKQKDCIYYEVTDTIYPASSSVKNCMGINKNKIFSKRYTFSAGGYHCMINFIIPENENCDTVIDTVIQSIQCN